MGRVAPMIRQDKWSPRRRGSRLVVPMVNRLKKAAESRLLHILSPKGNSFQRKCWPPLSMVRTMPRKPMRNSLVIMIETPEAVERADEIFPCPGSMPVCWVPVILCLLWDARGTTLLWTNPFRGNRGRCQTRSSSRHGGQGWSGSESNGGIGERDFSCPPRPFYFTHCGKLLPILFAGLCPGVKKIQPRERVLLSRFRLGFPSGKCEMKLFSGWIGNQFLQGLCCEFCRT